MANKLYEEGAILNIARAIREKNGTTDTYTVSQMPAAIRALEIGGGLDITGFNLTGGTFYLTGSGTSEAARTITHGLTNSSGQPIVPQSIYIYDPNCYFTMNGVNGYTKSIMYDTTSSTYYRRVTTKNPTTNTCVTTLVDSTSDTTGLAVTNTTFVLPNVMYFAMHNFCWIAIGTDNAGTDTITCKGAYTTT